MAALMLVPVTLVNNGEPTKKILRDIVGTFLTKEWATVDPETLVFSYKSSYANAHCPVERPTPASGSLSEPLKVFIKFHHTIGSDIDTFKHLVPSKQDEALLCYEYGRSSLGAKVYGFFQTQDGTLGRIDEFLDARNLEPEDVEDESIRSDIAKGLATFHSMKTNLKATSVEAYYKAVTGGLVEYHKLGKLKVLAKEGGVDLDELVDYDFAGRLEEAVSKLESMNAKKGWNIHDVQFMNTMVKKNPQPGESKVVLIDFEFVMQNYRAFDIGGHFMQKLFKWFDEENKIANCSAYTKKEKRHFCSVYAKQWNHLTGDEDSDQQLYDEAEYGYLLALAFDIHNMLCFMDKAGDNDPLNLHGLSKLFTEFKGQYNRLQLK